MYNRLIYNRIIYYRERNICINRVIYYRVIYTALPLLAQARSAATAWVIIRSAVAISPMAAAEQISRLACAPKDGVFAWVLRRVSNAGGGGEGTIGKFLGKIG